MSTKDKILTYWFFRVLPLIYFLYFVLGSFNILLKENQTFSDGIGLSLLILLLFPITGLWFIGNLIFKE
jgi:hypothetical protein